MRRLPLAVLAAFVGYALGALVSASAQPGNPNNPYSSTAGEKQRAVEYDQDGDHQAVNLRARATGTGTPAGTPTPAPAGRCVIRCEGDKFIGSVGGAWGAFASGGANGCVCAGSGTAATQTGISANATGSNASCFGAVCNATDTAATSIGSASSATTSASTALGAFTAATAVGGTAIGSSAVADQVDCIALGRAANCDAANQLMLGGTSHLINEIVPLSTTSDLGTATHPFRNLVAAEAKLSGVSGTGKAVCVKSDGFLGVCSDAVGAGGTCTCS